MTKRPGNSTYRWLNLSIVVTGVTASLLSAHLLQWQEEVVVATAPNSIQPVTSHTTIELPASTDLHNGQQNRNAVVVELAPVPTVAAPGSAPMPRPVARTRSSR